MRRPCRKTRFVCIVLALLLLSVLGAISASNSPSSVVLGVAAQTSPAAPNTTVNNNVTVLSDRLALGSVLHVEGVITTPEGPLPFVPVTLHVGGATVASTQTNESGAYTFSVPVGLNYLPEAFSGSASVYTVAELGNPTFATASSAIASIPVNQAPAYLIMGLLTGAVVLGIYVSAQPRPSRRVSVRSHLAGFHARIPVRLAWYEAVSLLLLLIGEGLIFAGYGVLGVGMQALNIATVAVIVVALHGERVQLVLVLALLSLFRVVNLSFTLVSTVTIYWLATTYGVMYVPIILFIIREKMTRYDLGIDDVRRSVLLLPLGVVVGTGFAFVEYAILMNKALIPNASVSELIQLSIVMIFFVALVEELLFRVLLQPQLIDRSGAVAGILLTSVIFGAMHSGYANVYELLFATGASQGCPASAPSVNVGSSLTSAPLTSAQSSAVDGTHDSTFVTMNFQVSTLNLPSTSTSSTATNNAPIIGKSVRDDFLKLHPAANLTSPAANPVQLRKSVCSVDSMIGTVNGTKITLQPGQSATISSTVNSKDWGFACAPVNHALINYNVQAGGSSYQALKTSELIVFGTAESNICGS